MIRVEKSLSQDGVHNGRDHSSQNRENVVAKLPLKPSSFAKIEKVSYLPFMAILRRRSYQKPSPAFALNHSKYSFRALETKRHRTRFTVCRLESRFSTITISSFIKFAIRTRKSQFSGLSRCKFIANPSFVVKMFFTLVGKNIRATVQEENHLPSDDVSFGANPV